MSKTCEKGRGDWLLRHYHRLTTWKWYDTSYTTTETLFDPTSCSALLADSKPLFEGLRRCTHHPLFRGVELNTVWCETVNTQRGSTSRLILERHAVEPYLSHYYDCTVTFCRSFKSRNNFACIRATGLVNRPSPLPWSEQRNLKVLYSFSFVLHRSLFQTPLEVVL